MWGIIDLLGLVFLSVIFIICLISLISYSLKENSIKVNFVVFISWFINAASLVIFPLDLYNVSSFQKIRSSH